MSSYCESMMRNYPGGSMMGGSLSYGWVTGGASAPGWMRGGALAAFDR